MAYHSWVNSVPTSDVCRCRFMVMSFKPGCCGHGFETFLLWHYCWQIRCEVAIERTRWRLLTMKWGPETDWDKMQLHHAITPFPSQFIYLFIFFYILLLFNIFLFNGWDWKLLFITFNLNHSFTIALDPNPLFVIGRWLQPQAFYLINFCITPKKKKKKRRTEYGTYYMMERESGPKWYRLTFIWFDCSFFYIRKSILNDDLSS